MIGARMVKIYSSQGKGEEIRSDPSPVGRVDAASTAHKHGEERRRRIRHPGDDTPCWLSPAAVAPGSSAVS
jgi:hypothetical protein